ncbi:MAG: hypothetical protein MAG715_00737 [Methanonatronarchaeales archaeon]|nr:hypothetical protein [Methanonatronarchaeales archaeon]
MLLRTGSRVLRVLILTALLTLGLSILAIPAYAADFQTEGPGSLGSGGAAFDGDPSTAAVLNGTGPDYEDKPYKGTVKTEVVYTLTVDGDTLVYRWSGRHLENVPCATCNGEGRVYLRNPSTGSWVLIDEKVEKDFTETGETGVPPNFVDDGLVEVKFQVVTEYERDFWSSEPLEIRELSFTDEGAQFEGKSRRERTWLDVFGGPFLFLGVAAVAIIYLLRKSVGGG